MHLYLRTKHGECYNAKNVEEALAQFLSSDGYRLSFVVDGKTFVLRRDWDVPVQTNLLDQQSLDCTVTIY